MKKLIDGWTITTEKGYGKPPKRTPMTFFCVVPPSIKTETRVDKEGLQIILPTVIYEKYWEIQ